MVEMKAIKRGAPTIVFFLLLVSCQQGHKSVVPGSSLSAVTLATSGSRSQSGFRLKEIANLPSGGWGSFHLEFINQKDGWLFKFDRLWRTADGGRTWELVYGTAPNLDRGHQCLQFVTSEVGWRCNGNIVEKTVDRGNHWETVTLPFKSDEGIIGGIRFLRDGRRGWLTGGLYRQVKRSQFGEFAPGMMGGDGKRALQGVVFYTEDSGKTWTQQEINTELGTTVWDVTITPTGRAWTTARHDTFYLEGNTWKKVDYESCAGNNKLLLETAVTGMKHSIVMYRSASTLMTTCMDG